MKDFTLSAYKALLKALQQQGFSFYTFAEYFKKTASDKSIILRHDVDKLPENSLLFAKIQAGLGIRGSYYFRIVPESFDEGIIQEIASLGHEIGYHYETMDKISEMLKVKSGKFSQEQLINDAYEEFCRNLEIFRKIVPVQTICMHGSPRSKFDNKDLWKKYDYKKLGIIGEPYFDIDFNKIFYITDTGRRWDGQKYNVRDKIIVETMHALSLTNLPINALSPINWPTYHSTENIINSINSGVFPKQVMMTFHPQRWTDKQLPWLRELVWQNVKNVVKYGIVKLRA